MDNNKVVVGIVTIMVLLFGFFLTFLRFFFLGLVLFFSMWALCGMSNLLFGTNIDLINSIVQLFT